MTIPGLLACHRTFIAPLSILLVLTPLAAQPAPAKTKKDDAAKITRSAPRPAWKHVRLTHPIVAPSDILAISLLQAQQKSVSKLMDALKQAGFDPKNPRSSESEKAAASLGLGASELIEAIRCFGAGWACHNDAMKELEVCVKQDCPPGKILSIGTCMEIARTDSNNCWASCGENDPDESSGMACEEPRPGPGIDPLPPTGGVVPIPGPGEVDVYDCDDLAMDCKDSSSTDSNGDLVTRDCTFSRIEFGGCKCACVTVTAVGSEMIVEGSRP